MATLSALKPGQILYRLSRRQMGNTSVRTTSVHRVQIMEVHEGYVTAGGPGGSRYRSRDVKLWRVSKPYMVDSIIGSSRLATRQEIKEAKAEGRLRESSDRIVIVRKQVNTLTENRNEQVNDPN